MAKVEAEGVGEQKMKIEEAIATCEGWFAYNERQRQLAVNLQELAAMARAGQQQEAQRRLRQLNSTSLKVYDGARLELAVRTLVDALGSKSQLKRVRTMRGKS